jgi:hypothetical protein
MHGNLHNTNLTQSSTYFTLPYLIHLDSPATYIVLDTVEVELCTSVEMS